MDPILLVIFIAALILLVGQVAFIARTYEKVEQGQALITNKIGTTEVTFSGGFVLSMVHHAERVDLRVKDIAIGLAGEEAPTLADGARAEAEVVFLVRVNATAEDVLAAARAVGSAGTFDASAVEAIFRDRCRQALHDALSGGDYDDFAGDHERLSDQILMRLGSDLGGYRLDAVAVRGLRRVEAIAAG